MIISDKIKLSFGGRFQFIHLIFGPNSQTAQEPIANKHIYKQTYKQTHGNYIC